MSQSNRDWEIDISKLPKSLELQLSPSLIESIANHATATGRSPEEIIIEMLDGGFSRYIDSTDGEQGSETLPRLIPTLRGQRLSRPQGQGAFKVNRD